MKTLLTISCALLLTSAIASAQHKSTPLTGVWRITRVQTKGGTPQTITGSEVQPSLFIFTGEHYSITQVVGSNPRPNLPADPNNASPAELLAVYGPFAANAGTYDIRGATLTLNMSVAKNPINMAPGPGNTMSFKVDGNTLTLTSLTTRNGAAPGTIITLTRVE